MLKWAYLIGLGLPLIGGQKKIKRVNKKRYLLRYGASSFFFVQANGGFVIIFD